MRPSSAVKRNTPQGSASSITRKKTAVTQGKNIWEIIAEKKKHDNHTEDGENSTAIIQQTEIETSVLFFGMKSSGKTTLLQKIMKKDVPTDLKSTIALEYDYGKKEDGFKTFIAHFWELAGGTQLLNLLDETISPDNIHTFVAVIVLDLSDPHLVLQALQELQVCLNKLKQISDKCFNIMKQLKSEFYKKILARQKKRFGENHADIEKISFSGISTIIIGSKFDEFEKMNNIPLQKYVTRTLRYLAHTNACTLMFMNNRYQQNQDQMELFLLQDRMYRNLMQHYLFGATLQSNFSTEQSTTDYLKPIRIYCGRDSLELIGNAPAVNNTKPIKIESTKNAELDKWIQTVWSCCNGMEMKNSPTNNLIMDNAKFKKILLDDFEEASVDAMRAQKDEELRHYKETVEKEKRRKAENTKSESKDEV